MSNANLKNIFLSPTSIAIVGASEKPGVGKAIFLNILNGYKGKVYPITPTSSSVFGLRAYKSVLDIDEGIDLAVVATPSKIVPSIMEEIGKKKIKATIIVSAGFKEVDESGAKLEQAIQDIGKHRNPDNRAELPWNNELDRTKSSESHIFKNYSKTW